MAELEFKGFKQVKLSTFESMSDATKKGYMWLVRDFNEEGEVKHSLIYFGTRLYAEINQDTEDNKKIENIIKSLGAIVNEEGEFIVASAGTFSGVTTLAEALEVIDQKMSGSSEDIETLSGQVMEFSAATVEDFAVLSGEVINLSAQTVIIESGLAVEIIERKEGDAKLGDEIDAIKTEVEELKAELEIEKLKHIITGDDVEEYADGEAEVAAIAEINEVAEKGGSIAIPTDVTTTVNV